MEDEKPPLPAPETVIDVGPAAKNTITASSFEDGRDGTGEKNKLPAAAAVEGSGFLARWKKNRAVKTEAAEKRREDDAEGGGMGNYSRILRYGTRLDAVLMIVGAFAAGAAGAVFPLFTIILGSLVSKFSEFFREGSTVSPAEFRHSVNTMCLLFVYLFLGKFGLAYVAMVCFRITGTRISAGLRLQYLTAIFHQDLTYFDTVSTPKAAKSSMNNHPGRTTASSSAAAASAMSGSAGAVAVSITTLANMVQIGISEKLAMFIQGTCTLISAFTIALTRNWKLSLVTSIILPIIVIIYAIAVPIDIKLEKRVLKAHEKAADLAQECLGSVRTIKSFCAETRLGERYAKLLEEGKKAGIRKAPIAGLQYFGGFFAIYCGYAVCFWFGIKLFVWGQIKEVGTIVIVFFSVLIAVMSFGNIAPPIGAMAKAASASSSMFAVIDRKPVIDALSPAGLKPSKMLTGDLRLENIKFAYPGGGKRDQVVVLGGDDKKGVSIVFREGQTTAIVGRSGCGKSTIVALLERWYDPMQGTVFIGDTAIKDVNLRWWRSRIGLVMQEPFMFNDTIYNNVVWGLTGTEWENAEEEVKRRLVVEACEEANASVFIDTLEKKYDTRVGEQGIMLSGGQKQRVAIARSIISKPSILILDEATSAIDPKNERIVQDALDKVSVGRTTITIAHRLSTVRKADNIIVLDAGKVLESGSHEELLKNEDGAYTMLVKGQSLVTEDNGEEEIKEVIFEEETTGGALLSKINTTLTTRTSPDDIETGLPQTTDVAVENGKTKPPQFGLMHCLSIMFYEQRHLWWLYAIALATCLGAGGAYPAQAVLFAKFISIFQVGDSAKFVKDGYFWALMFFVLACATGVSYFFMGISFTVIQHHITSRYRLEYFLNVLRQPISFFDLETSSAGALTSQINTDPAALQELLGTNSGILTISIVNMIGCCVLSLAFGWKLGLVCMFAALPFVFSAGLLRVRIEISFAGDAERVFRESAQFASEAVAAYRTVSSLILEEMILERYRTLLSAHVKRSAWKTAKACVLFSASESIGLLAGALTFWYGGKLLSTREYKTEQFFVIYTAIVQGGEAAGQFFAFTPSMAQALASCNNILKIRESGPPQTGGPMPPPPATGSHGCEIEFKNVCFKYSSRDTPVFKGLNLKIEAGQFVAFVGASGCGKTTIISLLERFYDVDEGEILIDGKRLDQIDVKEYRSAVSLVAQEPVLYQGTITDNILLGVDPSSPAASQASIEHACKQAYIHDFITSLPDGYSTLCGSKGIGLSGGQKQRVAIARALIRNPRLLLLDEATAALDSESEGFVQKAILGSREAGRTIIAVAHRLSTIVNADVVFVVVEGKIMEKGTHKELIKKRGVYWEMCRAQALDR